MEHFDGRATANVFALGLEYHAHAALAELANDTIPAD